MTQTHTISELAKEFALTPRTLRHYENQGLLRPRRDGTARLFNARDRWRLKLALKSASLGFSLHEIKGLFDSYDAWARSGASTDFVSRLGDWRARLLERRADIDALLTEVDFFAKESNKSARSRQH
jgi:DNA-binding transcriptional MerR regulator